MLGSLVFGSKADRFERALDELSAALGFAGERPDKEWKEGPDNLWALDDTHYIVWECKNEVGADRAEINKREAEQMNRSSSWFEKHYPGLKARRIMIHPAKKVESAATDSCITQIGISPTTYKTCSAIHFAVPVVSTASPNGISDASRNTVFQLTAS